MALDKSFRKPSIDEVKNLYTDITLLAKEGRSRRDAHIEIMDKYGRRFSSDPYFPASEIEFCVNGVYDSHEAAAKSEESRRSKEARAVALYDALISLGWTPPA